MKPTKPAINKFLREHKQNVTIKVAQKKGDLFIFRGEFVHDGKPYSGDTYTKIAEDSDHVEERLKDIIEGFENAYSKITS